MDYPSINTQQYYGPVHTRITTQGITAELRDSCFARAGRK